MSYDIVNDYFMNILKLKIDNENRCMLVQISIVGHSLRNTSEFRGMSRCL